MEHREIQLAAVRNQRSEIRRQKSGVKLISDLRLLTSMIDDFYDFNDLPFTVYCLQPDSFSLTATIFLTRLTKVTLNT